MKNFTLFISIFFLFVACKHKSDRLNNTEQSNIYNIQYATSFMLDSVGNHLIYSLKKDGIDKTISIDFSRLPFKNIVTTSSSAVAFLDAIGKSDNIKGVYDVDWIYNETLHKQIESNQTKDLGNSNGIDIERLLELKPDAIIVFSDPNKTQLFNQLEENGIQVIYVDEYLEQSPLGKAEYIKFFGILTGDYTKANQLFKEIETSYSQVKKEVENVKNKPTILANTMMGDIWYMPGGKSFPAQFFEDAGGDYLWKNNDKEGSVNLDFEEVYSQAENADYWLNTANFKTLEELGNSYKNNDWFKAFKNKKVYTFSKRINEKGANDYFETGTVRPDLILKDLIHIIHPEILPNHKLYFYQKLE